MAYSIPERWLQYEAYGRMIKDTKILPFKVPLKNELVEKLPLEERFTPSALLQAFPHLTHIIDLTNTTRYYDEVEFSNANVQYWKINVPGQMVPPDSCVNLFFQKMDHFLMQAGKDDIVGIHCTHGINRTGYLICRYFIEKLGWTFEDSLKAFEEARGYNIECKRYVSDLFHLSHKKRVNAEVQVKRHLPRLKPRTVSSRDLSRRHRIRSKMYQRWWRREGEETGRGSGGGRGGGRGGRRGGRRVGGRGGRRIGGRGGRRVGGF